MSLRPRPPKPPGFWTAPPARPLTVSEAAQAVAGLTGWQRAVYEALVALGGPERHPVARRALTGRRLIAMIRRTASHTKEPGQAVSLAAQRLRRKGLVDYAGPGFYRLVAPVPDPRPQQLALPGPPYPALPPPQPVLLPNLLRVAWRTLRLLERIFDNVDAGIPVKALPPEQRRLLRRYRVRVEEVLHAEHGGTERPRRGVRGPSA